MRSDTCTTNLTFLTFCECKKVKSYSYIPSLMLPPFDKGRDFYSLSSYFFDILRM